MQLSRRSLGLGALILALARELSACPSFVLAHRLPIAAGTEPRREQLQLFAYDKPTQSWSNLPLQLDPLDVDGNLLFPLAKEWRQAPLDPQDRLSFQPVDFGARFDSQGKAPCDSNARQLIEFRQGERFAYLAKCNGKDGPEGPVSFDEKERWLQSKYYRYRYSARNHLVFDEIQLADPQFKGFSTAALKSDLMIIGDVKKFLTLVFDTDDLEAKIAYKRSGAMGFVAGLQFYLRILAFRIEMSLMPEVNFFDDSLFMPMTMYLPVDATKYLRRGSGVYYTWESDPATEWLPQDSRMEALDATRLQPERPLPALDLQYCGPRFCRYSLAGRIHGRSFSLNFAINRQAAELGFFPRLIRDVAAVERSIGRPISNFASKGRMGVFFETAQLPQGTHKWDFWIRVPDEQRGSCEQAIAIRPVDVTKVNQR